MVITCSPFLYADINDFLKVGNVIVRNHTSSHFKARHNDVGRVLADSDSNLCGIFNLPKFKTTFQSLTKITTQKCQIYRSSRRNMRQLWLKTIRIWELMLIVNIAIYWTSDHTEPVRYSLKDDRKNRLLCFKDFTFTQACSCSALSINHKMPTSNAKRSSDSDKKSESRRRRNVESAKRSRERLKNEHKWMEIQLSENEDRVRKLEKRVKDLTSELMAPPRKGRNGLANVHSERPSWHGEPF